MSFRQSLTLLLLASLAAPVTAQTLRLDAPDEIRELLAPYLPEAVPGQRRLEGQLAEILATEGYFSPQFSFGNRATEDDDTLPLRIDPGPRTLVGSVTLAVDGEIPPKQRTALEADWRLPVGAPFRQADWNAAKQDILARLLAHDYADARLLDSRAEIDPDARRAELHAHYATGPRYRFGPLMVDGLQRFPPSLVARYQRVAREGDPYTEDALGTLQATLQSTPYFATVQARLDREAAVIADDGSVTAPVRVTVRERPAHRVGFGGGASSNTGARVEANYHTPDLFGQAWAFDTGLRLEQKRQVAFADVFLPPDAKQRRHSVGAMAEATDIQGLRTERYAIGGQSVQQRGRLEQRLSLNWQEEQRWPDGSTPVLSHALVPNVMWTWRQLDNPLDPRTGTVLQVQIGGGSKAALSDQNFVRSHGRWQQYIELGRRNQLALRAELGYTLADSREHIPQDYLFRTGGTGSVRGYAYQSLGVREGSAVVGGRYLAVASAEATHWLDDAWGVAAFIDAGDAVDSLKDARLAVGYGLGARWRSPAGPIGVDIGYGQRTEKFQLHFSLAIPF